MARQVAHYAKFLFYPWSLWWLCAYYPRRLRARYAARSVAGVFAAWLLQFLCYVIIGFPMTIYVTGELLISLNEAVIAEQSNYRLQSDFDAGLADRELEIPGPKTPEIVPVPYAQSDEYRRYLVERYAPVIVHKMSAHPQWDIPVFLDFDGNMDPRDNLENEPRYRPHRAGVYGELTAETEDSYYLTYSLYHVKDYDHPIREALTRWSYHDNDNEGFMIRVDKQSMEVADASTWFHNRFLLFNRTGVSTGSEPVHGKVRTEGGTHIIIYAQPQGHGVRCAQAADGEDLLRNAKVLRFQGGRPAVPTHANRKLQIDATYELRDFRKWYSQALGPFGKDGQGTELFEETIPLGNYEDGTPMVIGRFIGGRDYAVGSWSRPKPMWSWDDGWDDIPVLVWHFAPSYAFASHSGQDLSHVYLYDEPATKVFGRPIDEVLALATQLPKADRQGMPKWGAFAHRGADIRRDDYWEAMEVLLKRYVNYLFHALG
ncbi:MAG: hypothetical protein KDH09_04165 [Chrysiogenetes bacterium]|nr:hypothetical protein [Chrysiogenetes bacterium]